jgi:hypothetical protein
MRCIIGRGFGGGIGCRGERGCEGREEREEREAGNVCVLCVCLVRFIIKVAFGVAGVVFVMHSYR